MLWFLWAGVAFGAVPVELPEAEPAEAWRRAVSLAGASLGPASGAPSVRLVDEGARWRVVVVDRDGRAHELVVAEPATEAAREDLISTAVSLTVPVSATLGRPSFPEVPPKPAPRPKPQPAPEPEIPPPTPVVEPPPEPPIEVAPAPEPVAEPVREAPPLDVTRLGGLDDGRDRAERLPWYARVGAGAVGRVDGTWALGPELTAGLRWGSGGVGLSARARSATVLFEARPDGRARGYDLAVTLERGEGLWGAVDAGIVRRDWRDGDASLGWTTTPFARAAAGWRLPIAPAWSVIPHAWLSLDLAPTEIFVGGRPSGTLDRPSFGVSASLSAGGKKVDHE